MIHTLLAVALLFFGATTGPLGVSSNGSLSETTSRPHFQAIVPVASSQNAGEIQPKIVVLKRTRRGDEMEVRFRIEFNNVPQEKRYRLHLLTGYMKNNGLPEVDLSEQFGIFSPDEKKQLSMESGVILYKGEWIQLRLQSLDRSINTAARFILFK